MQTASDVVHGRRERRPFFLCASDNDVVASCLTHKSQNPCFCKGFGADRRRLASIVKAEGMGFEPDADFDATGILPCGCMICPECRAALALQTGRPEWLNLALNDAGLQRVLIAWATLTAGQRRAILARIEAIR